MSISVPEGYKIVFISPREIEIVKENYECSIDKIDLDKFDETIEYLKGFSKKQLLEVYGNYQKGESYCRKKLGVILIAAYHDEYEYSDNTATAIASAILGMSKQVVPYLIKNGCKDIINEVLYKHECDKHFNKNQCIVLAEAMKDSANAEIYANMFVTLSDE